MSDDVEIYFKGDDVPETTKEEWKSFIDEIYSRPKQENSLKDWAGKTFETYTEVNAFLETVKKELVNRPLKAIWVMGNIFNDDRDYYVRIQGKWFERQYPNRYVECDGPEWDDSKTEDVFMTLDEPVVLIIGDRHFEIEFSVASSAVIGMDSLTMTEKSYQSGRNDWRDVSKYYSTNIVGRTVKDIVVIPRSDPPGFWDPGLNSDRTDLYEEIQFVMDNGYKLIIGTDIDYMFIGEKKNPEETNGGK